MVFVSVCVKLKLFLAVKFGRVYIRWWKHTHARPSEGCGDFEPAETSAQAADTAPLSGLV